MKHFSIFSFLVILSLALSAQSNRELMNNFMKNDANIVYWQLVRDTELTRNELLDAIIESGYFTNIDVTGDKVVCELRPYRLNYEQYSRSGLDLAPAYLTQNLIAGTVIIELSNNRYRTTVKNIRFIDNTQAGLGIVTPIEYWVLNRSQDLKFSLFKNGSELLDKDFTVKTAFRRTEGF